MCSAAVAAAAAAARLAMGGIGAEAASMTVDTLVHVGAEGAGEMVDSQMGVQRVMQYPGDATADMAPLDMTGSAYSSS